MKKTLMGVFAFVLVMVMVLTSSVYAMRSSDDVMTEAAKVKKVTEGAITIDGNMDDAYKDATPLYIDIPGEIPPEGLYTYAVARFVWSEKALYCFVIVNDMNVQCPDNASPWEQDSVELFLDWNNTAKYDLSAVGISADTVLSRSFQYRISAKGRGTCYLDEDGKKTYEYDATKGRFYSDGGKTITDSVNYFGWNKGDYAAASTRMAGATTGYTVEFRIPHDGLKNGQEIGFDFQINEVYDWNAKTNKVSQMQLFYNSAKRGGQVSTINTAQYYDWLTLTDDQAAEQAGERLSLTELVNYGLANTNTQRATVTTTKTVARTSRLTLNASRNTKKVTTKATSTTASGDNSSGGSTDNSGTTDTGSSGCGSSIAIGSSVAMISLVGVAGFFSFRRKKDDEE